MLNTQQQQIAALFDHEPLTESEGSQQYPAEIDFWDDGKVGPFLGAVYKNKEGILRLFWIPQGRNFAAEYDDLVGWYDVPTMEEVEGWVFDSVCEAPSGDEVEPDHPDSWLSLLGVI